MQTLISSKSIESKIFTIRNKQVMIDKDLAELYGVQTKVLNQAVKRNKERFPEDFMFRLSKLEFEGLDLRSQIVTSSSHGGRRHLPFVFTEQGVSMLASVLKSKRAIEMSIQIIRAFVAMRKFLLTNAQVFQRLDQAELELLEHDKKINQLFAKFEITRPKQGIFFDGQVFDAYSFINNLIKQAKESVILIDNYVDESVLVLFSGDLDIKVKIFTKINKKLLLDLEKYSQQYKNIEIFDFELSHDRFLIIDEKELYHIGASLKDLGRKWFAFTKMEFGLEEILKRLQES